jgi:exodeoxyribonuclease-1
MLSETRAAEFGIDTQLCHAQWQKLLTLDLGKLDFEQVFGFQDQAARDAELALYEAFIPDSDRRIADSIHLMLPDELRLANLQFQDKRLQELLFRYRARNYPDSLTPDETQQWSQWVANKLERGEPYGKPVSECLEEIDQLLTERESTAEQEVLKQLQNWLHNLRSKYSQA